MAVGLYLSTAFLIITYCSGNTVKRDDVARNGWDFMTVQICPVLGHPIRHRLVNTQ
ncbi:hypothetical protein SERLA73DRAFT_143055 [Serpula lacrymans var. lacrymans S7.3]|uniref:Uncharacterized protein n=2 Tax=Serpula lacrymans var. lacrymans TaxID=341189 RepID=F8Q8X2_SERL3|nr:uncharacterized protein SERLADRAFT_399429 [Serpula lacrymans var. lacrymans S7.9]EGN95027.1 hypothetical protein SERLA73DRAFT_143055 [Serpula lacrymans var. lacrymans S7.3]EGO20521.1 hypothetical protein SERLADRAFT_399429 [Serpula lacrymans var. lacrymans S7.9]